MIHIVKILKVKVFPEHKLAIDVTPVFEILICNENTFLLQSVNTMRESTSFEVDIYIKALEVASRIVSERR